MKLKPVPARTGWLWVKLGIATFARQPLALAGLFLLYMLALSLLSALPVIGNLLALALLPATTLGLMVATREADRGKFPLPTLILSAFRAGRERLRAMLVLGAVYALGFMAVLGVSALFDGGQFAQVYLGSAEMTQEVVLSDSFQQAMWIGMLLYLPLALLFWHAPALVHWQGISPAKSLFFSLMACWQNKGALALFMLAWMGVFMVTGLVLSLLGSLLGSPDLLASLLFAAALTLAAMFFSSFYFTFRDSFSDDDGQPLA
ncbi:BPSS1780 family membrane protein [Malikia sp.]|uniref:BPSS1780 family membrane protein n=1 Tax=Malikia sp. TaxID=2070706 RepID=UPI00262A6594|nr:BPSS1780 family membrane protein [Malikia sp.]MDD2728894.1 BPSS1780 family membrane protein [Malikia sp.]